MKLKEFRNDVKQEVKEFKKNNDADSAPGGDGTDAEIKTESEVKSEAKNKIKEAKKRSRKRGTAGTAET